MEYFTLRSDIKIPCIGFGPGILGYSAKMKDQINNPILKFYIRAHNKFVSLPIKRKKYIDAIASGFRNGYRLLDYSNSYGNLPLIKEAIDKSGVKINDLFLTSRISNRSQEQNNVREEVLHNLEQWGVESVDLLQFHWPVTDYYIQTWEEMIKLKEEGYVKVLGVANCHKHHIETLKKETGVIPEINQIEIHPLFTQKPLLNYCKENDITVEAYTPVARYDDRLVRLPLLKRLEEKYNKNFIQIILRWHIQNGVIPVIRSLNPKHQKSNLDIFDFTISKEDMDLIDNINLNSRLRYDPDNCDFSIL